MQLEIIEKKENKLLEREALTVRGTSEGATPTRIAVKQALVSKLKVPAERVVVRAMSTHFGEHAFSTEVHIYQNPERAAQIEPTKFRKKNAAPTPATEDTGTAGATPEKKEASSTKDAAASGNEKEEK